MNMNFDCSRFNPFRSCMEYEKIPAETTGTKVNTANTGSNSGISSTSPTKAKTIEIGYTLPTELDGGGYRQVQVKEGTTVNQFLNNLYERFPEYKDQLIVFEDTSYAADDSAPLKPDYVLSQLGLTVQIKKAETDTLL